MTEKNPGLAAVLNAFIPGAGFLYIGNIGLALLALFGTTAGLVFGIVPGIVLWLMWILIVYNQANSYNKQHFMVCSNCAKMVPKIASQCAYCGTKIVVKVMTQAEEIEIHRKKKESLKKKFEDEYEARKKKKEALRNTEAYKKAKRKSNWILIIVLIVFVAIIVLWAIFVGE